MSLIIPKTIFGKTEQEMEEAYNRIVNAKEEKPTPIKQKTKLEKDNFIYVPSINLWIAKERTYLKKNWFECHQLLQQENKRMPTIPEFIEFLKYCRENYQDIYNEITEVKDPWRAEWLDADFKVENNKLNIHYNHIVDANGKILKYDSQIIDKDTLMQDKTPGISLDDYLDSSHTNQGLPIKKIKSGNLYYLYPRSDNNSVARFGADSDSTMLYCARDPSDRSSGLGVRAVRRE